MISSFLKWGWSNLPIPKIVRDYILQRVQYPTLKHVYRQKEYLKGIPLIAGFIKSGLGIGEGARLQILALRGGGVPHSICDISQIMNIRDLDDLYFESRTSPSAHGPLVVHANPPEFGRALKYLGSELTKDRPVIGCWAWELPEIPNHWSNAYQYVDEIWVPSAYTQKAFASSSPVPVRIVPYPVSVPPSAGMSRLEFSLPEKKCLFLAMGDARSDLERKNFLGVIAAFKMVLKEVSDVGLVLKLHHTAHAGPDYQKLLQSVRDVPEVIIIDNLMSRGAVGDLFRVTDCYVSLHRAEGFGLTMAEAMLLGRPVIATRYSGNLDFMNDECSRLIDYKLVPVVSNNSSYSSEKHQCWAEPSIQMAAAAMIDIATCPDLRSELGKKARQHALDFFSNEGVVRAFKEAELRCNI